MLSRGRIMVSMALQAKRVATNTDIRCKIQGSDLKCMTTEETISMSDSNNNRVVASTSKQPESDIRDDEEVNLDGIGLELAASGNDSNFEIDDLYDENTDDDVRDPSYLPESSSDSDENDNNTIPEFQIDHEEIVDINRPGKKRRCGSQRSRNKKLRMNGKAYKGMQKVDGRWVQCIERGERLLCPRNCSKRCEKSRSCFQFSEDERQNVFEAFWTTMNWDERKVYVNSLVGSRTTAVKKVEDSRRNRSYQYYLWKNDTRKQVCKNMFLSTLGIGEQSVYGWCKNASNGIPNKGEASGNRKAEQERRHNELRMGVRRFLDEIPKLESHYCRSSSSKLYLEPVFDSLSALHKEYTNYCESHTLPVAHRKVFETLFSDMNLSLFTPKKDQCDTCCGHESGNIQEDVYQAHIQRKNSARSEKERDKELAKQDPTLKVVTMDLQSVLLCPRLNASALYYKTKLACHNFTIMDLTSKQVQCYFWHEGQGDLSSNSFASCIAHYIESLLRDNNLVKHIIFYSDGCTYQNRNVVLANTLSHICRKFQIQVTQKYLERGHTQMEVDSVHSVIERKLKRKNIYVPQNYVEVIRESCSVNPYLVHYVDHAFFKKYSDLSYYSTIRPGTKVGDPVVTNIRVLHYCPNGDVTIKLTFDEDLSDLPRRARRSDVHFDYLAQLHSSELAIKRSKFDHLMQLKAVIPMDYHAFYDNLIYR